MAGTGTFSTCEILGRKKTAVSLTPEKLDTARATITKMLRLNVLVP